MLSNKPLISVIIPAYNHEQFVCDAIRSIIAQTYKNIELIIINDGSTDDTWDKINELKDDCKKRFINIHFETQENQGTCTTLNRLIKLANGEYIYLIASDDLAKPSAIEKQLKEIIQNKAVVAVGNNEFINNRSERIGWDKHRNSTNIENAEYRTFADFLQIKQIDTSFGTYKQLLQRNHIPIGCLILASAIKQIPQFSKDAPLEDYFMHLQLSKIGKYVFIDEILFSYRWHGSNTAKIANKMRAITRKTMEYEQNLVSQEKYSQYKQIFEEVKYSTKTLFSIGNLIKLYKTKHLFSKKLILAIGKYKFTLKSKD